MDSRKPNDKAGKARVNRTISHAWPDEYDAMMLAGGALNADQARANESFRKFIHEMDRAGKPMPVICSAPWELISAGVIRGRKLTSWATIQHDIRNAGGQWEDREVVVDRNLVTSRGPKDLPAFNREMVALFARVSAGSHR